VLGACACAAFALGVDALLVLLGGGLAAVVVARWVNEDGVARSFAPGLVGAAAAGGSAVAAPAGLLSLFLAFLKVGAVVFGSGYVLLAFLRADLVDRLHWLTEPQLLDAVAVGQVTPGPVFTTATFIGYVIGARQGTGMGVLGAVATTVGIFLPGFLLVAVTRPLVARVRRSPMAGAFLDGVNVAALALMAVVSVQLARSALVDVPTIALALASGVALIRFKVNTTWLVAAGALVGVVVSAAP
jgi:chromate transporter